MYDPPRHPNPDDDPGVRPDGKATPGTPRWVKVFGAVVGSLVLLFVILKLFGIGGDHGPGRHTPGNEPAGKIEQEGPGGDVLGDDASSDGEHQ